MTAMSAVDVTEIDDVIPKLFQNQIEAETTSNRMAWYHVVETSSGADGDTNYSGFFHIPFHVEDSNVPPSPMTALLLPLLFAYCDKAQVALNRLIRIRLGLFPRIVLDAAHNPHVDFYQPHKTALYYVNDADGDTLIFNETYEQVPKELAALYKREQRFTVAKRISPRKGRMAGFDGRHYHASMHPMQASHRIVIAFSFL
jgi:hypothetical protein